ncbi:transporter substrate-binding domain-containing protein [Pseudoalteromonas xiamenensis]|uniref:substrate-binding periplasmic protein n=1 Tax=Pseudoalteromonas xiamenensis TaxID=882626 RepID=UPI0027E48EFA|nr:transporter substrate-binding domain-containing protein [Pseudoalteromonas xiamenensis]WMN59584.1 transporter substrate-binding domain-containing protein [Pseudoalteromonas xiamenensis]
MARLTANSAVHHVLRNGFLSVGKLMLLLLLFATRTMAEPQYRVSIMVDESYPPYTYMINGELNGIYVDLVRQAARLIDSKYQVELVPVPWKRGLADLEHGAAFAIMPPYKHIQKRPYIWPYSVPLLEEVVVAYCNSGFTLKNIEHRDTSKNPINLGINAGYLILDDVLTQALAQNKIQVWENKDTYSNVMKLVKGRIDCYLNDRLSTVLVMRNIKRSEPDIELSGVLEDRVILRRTAHIGYVKDGLEQYPYKLDFIAQMDEALLKVMASQTPELEIN